MFLYSGTAATSCQSATLNILYFCNNNNNKVPNLIPPPRMQKKRAGQKHGAVTHGERGANLRRESWDGDLVVPRTRQYSAAGHFVWLIRSPGTVYH